MNKIPWYQKNYESKLVPALPHLPLANTLEALIRHSGDKRLNTKLTEVVDMKEYMDALSQLWMEIPNDDIRAIAHLKGRIIHAVINLTDSIDSLSTQYAYWKKNQIDQLNNFFDQQRQYKQIYYPHIKE